MPSHTSPVFLFASAEAPLLAAIEPQLLQAGARVEVALAAQAALAAMGRPDPPNVALFDALLPGMTTGQLLAAARTRSSGPRIPILLIAETVTQECIDYLAEGAADDLILRSAESGYWQLRLDLLMRNQRVAQELETLRDAAIRNAQLDHLTVFTIAKLCSPCSFEKPTGCSA